MTKISHGNPLGDWNLLLSQRQELMNNDLAKFPFVSNQEGTMEIRYEVVSGVGAGDLDTSRYPVSYLDDVEPCC